MQRRVVFYPDQKTALRPNFHLLFWSVESEDHPHQHAVLIEGANLPPVRGPVCTDHPPPQTVHVLSWATRDHGRATQSDHTHLRFRIALTELRCKVTCPILLHPLRNNSPVTASVFVKTTQSRREIHHRFGCQNAAENFVHFIRRCPPL